MIIVDIVMPTGGNSGGGVENILYLWSQNVPDDNIELRFFHISPGRADYLKGYKNQWTMPFFNDSVTKLTVDYCAEAYSEFLNRMGAPDICIATWIPMVSKACYIVREAGEFSFPILSFLHGIISSYEPLGFGGLKELCFADGHLCISKMIESEITSGIKDAFTILISNPLKKVQVDDFIPDNCNLCFVGRLSPEKNVNYILRSIAEAKDDSWKLTVVGDGELKNDLMNLSNELGISERVFFAGWQENPWEVCNKCRYVVLASKYEGCNGTVREASSVGMTVLSTPVGGVTDYIIPGKNGYLFTLDGDIGLTEILNGISEGILLPCQEEACKASVSQYYTDSYFAYIKKLLVELAGIS